ncbi:ATP-binding protein [Kitasatospora sp. NPDC059146]|uniref:ATP-binding protein n=1 Tax=Kitasatospora sp. NPDC059146 TaxID=3346741 RepID=UPI0036AA73B4
MTTAELAPAEPAPRPGPATASLRYRPESARAARLLVRGKLTEWGLAELVDPAELIVTELVSNACKTGCLTFMQVAVRRPAPGFVRVSVRDGSSELPVLLEAGEDEECHRGLALVHELTGGRWGTTLESRGKSVHADLPIP